MGKSKAADYSLRTDPRVRRRHPAHFSLFTRYVLPTQWIVQHTAIKGGREDRVRSMIDGYDLDLRM